MTIPTLFGTGGHQSSSQAYDSANYYSNVGLGRSAMASGAVTTESNANRPIRAAGSMSYLSWGVAENGFGADLTLALRKGLSATAMSVAIPSSTTGWFTDNVHSISVSSGDVLAYSTHLSTTCTYTGSFYCVSMRFNASTDSAQMLTTFGPSGIAPDTTRKFVNFQGVLDSGTTTEAGHQFYCLADGDWQNLACYVEGNDCTRSTTVSSRKNAGSGSTAVSISTSTTGYFEDTTHSDSVNVGDLLNYAFVATPTPGSGSMTMNWVGAHFVATDSDLCLIGGSQGGGALISDATARYTSLFGGGRVDVDTPRATGLFPYDLTASKFTNYLTGSVGGAVGFTLLVNGSSSALAVSASSSGFWTDSTHTVSIDAGDICANEIEVTAGSVTWASGALLLEAS
jgi:hypothetical protein